MSNNRRSSRPYGGGVTPTPLKGALVVEGEGEASLALKMLVDQMQAYQQQNLLELQAMSAAMYQQTEQVKVLQLEIAEIKREAAAALVETRLKLQKLMEQKPTDPATLQQMVKAAQEKAKREMHEAEIRFQEALKTMPRGTLINDTPERIRLIINGVDQFLKPGLNHNIPQAFIDHWEKRKDEQRWASGLNDAFLARTKEGDFFGAEYYNNILANANDERPNPIVEIAEV